MKKIKVFFKEKANCLLGIQVLYNQIIITWNLLTKNTPISFP